MKFICRSYVESASWRAMSEIDRTNFTEACCAYRRELQNSERLVEEQRRSPGTAGVTLCQQNGQVVCRCGHVEVAEEKNGELLIIEARDLNHAIALMSRHPGVRLGGVEICPAEVSGAP